MNISARVTAGLILLSCCAALPVSVFAATISVSADGMGGCPLRSAIRAANTDAPSSPCPAGSGTDTLVLQQLNGVRYFTYGSGSDAGSDEDLNVTGDLDVTSSIIVQGVSATQSVIVGPELDRAFDVLSTGALTLNDVTVIGGSVAAANSNDGGVVRKGANATLTINRSALRGGVADQGGAIHASGAGVLTLDKVTVFSNQAGFGGGISLQQSAGAEAILNNLTLSGNTATFSGGGIYASSGFRLRNTTVARNRAGAGGGGVHYAGSSTTAVNFANSLLIDNVNVNGNPLDLYCSSNATLGARAFTLFGAVVNCMFASFSGIPTSTDARISPLFDFGSGLPTHALLAGSAATNAGNPSTSIPLTACLANDARGVSRSAPCDLGAYEHGFDVTVNSFSDLPDLNPGDGLCQSLGNVCTLRAVTMESSASGGRWFVNLPAGTYPLNRAITQVFDNDGGDLDVKQNTTNDVPLQMTLFGAGDVDDTQIVGGGFDRILEVRGGNFQGGQFVHFPLSFALLNATVSGGDLTDDSFNADPNPSLGGGGIKVTGAKTLFYNVIVQDNHVDVFPPTTYAAGGGAFFETGANSGNDPPFATSAHLERFAVVDNSSLQYAGGIWAQGASPFETSDGITLVNGIVADNQGGDGGGAVISQGVAASFLSVVNNTCGPLAPPGFARYAGGLTVFGYQNNSVRNVLISGNQAGTEGSDCEVISGIGSSLVSLGYNLIGTAGAGCAISGDTSSNLLNVNPLLGARTASAGMPVYVPAVTGPAANVIPLSLCSNGGGFGVHADVRGVQRPGSGSSFCDIGAVESELPLFANSFE